MPDITDLVWSGGQAVVRWMGGKMRSNATSAMPTTPPMLKPPVFQPPVFQASTNLPEPTVAVPAGFGVPALSTASGISTLMESAPLSANSYASHIARGIACATCTKDHLATMAAAAEALEQAQAQGNADEVRYQLARVAAEVQSLQRYDWSPEKIAATPEDRLVAVRAVQPLVATLTAQLPTPKDIALAWGATDESIRFTRGRMTDRDRQEIAIRLQDADERTNYLERVAWSPEKNYGALPPDQAEQWLTELREARHVVAQDPYDGQHLKRASQQLAQVAVGVTPLPSDTEITAICGQIREAQRVFYRTYFGV